MGRVRRLGVLALFVVLLLALSPTVAQAGSLSAPGGMRARVKSSSAVTLSWRTVSGAVSYRVYQCNSADGSFFLIATTKSQSITVSHLTASKTYRFRVRAVNKKGIVSSPSRTVRATTGRGMAAPSGLEATSTTSSKITLRWSGVKGATAYAVYRYDSVKKAYVYIGKTDKKSYVCKGLAASSRYSFKVRAAGSKGEGLFSGAAAAYTKPSAPSGLSGATTGFTSVRLSWKAVSGASSYRLYRASSANGSYALIATTRSLSYADGKLQSGKTYYYRVSAVGKGGEGGHSMAQAATQAVYAAPCDIQTLERGIDRVTVGWKAVSQAQRYRVYRFVTASEAWVQAGETTTTQFACTGLPADAEIRLRVAAVGAYGQGTLSAIYTARTTAPLAEPAGLTADAKGSLHSVALAWSPVDGAEGYHVYRRTGESGRFALLGSTASTTFLCDGLEAATTYYFKVAAVRGSDEGTTTEPVPVRTGTPLSAPGGFAVQEKTWSTIRLAWKTVPNAEEYVVEAAPDAASAFTTLLVTSSLDCAIDGLDPGTACCYRVSARNAYGTGASATLSVTTLTVAEGSLWLQGRIANERGTISSRQTEIYNQLLALVEVGKGHGSEADTLVLERKANGDADTALAALLGPADAAADGAALDAVLSQMEAIVNALRAQYPLA